MGERAMANGPHRMIINIHLFRGWLESTVCCRSGNGRWAPFSASILLSATDGKRWIAGNNQIHILSCLCSREHRLIFCGNNIKRIFSAMAIIDLGAIVLMHETNSKRSDPRNMGIYFNIFKSRLTPIRLVDIYGPLV